MSTAIPQSPSVPVTKHENSVDCSCVQTPISEYPTPTVEPQRNTSRNTNHNALNDGSCGMVWLPRRRRRVIVSHRLFINLFSRRVILRMRLCRRPPRRLPRLKSYRGRMDLITLSQRELPSRNVVHNSRKNSRP